MLAFSEPTIYQQSKCYFTHGRLGHLDPSQLPTTWKSKGKPWTALLAQEFVRRVSTLLGGFFPLFLPLQYSLWLKC